MLTSRKTAFRRSALLVSTALFMVAGAQAAQAQHIDPVGAEREAQGGSASITGGAEAISGTESIGDPYGLPEAQTFVGTVRIDPEPQITIADPNTPTTARDPVNITGIGQMVVDQGGGFIGLCTATLINPRTVIFAAHCVNSRAQGAYGTSAANPTAGTGIAFGFETNTRANATGETDELVRWLLGGTGGAGRFQTNLAQNFYNSNWVAYNQFSLEPAAQLFLYGDVAVASLDTPAASVPTWALLFSPLTNTGTIGAAGTGFNVGIVGYGRNGTGSTGAGTTIDYRRRAAENILGALTDLQTFESFLFGGAPNGLTQNLYFMDFDDPRRGMSGASPFDFNAFRDNARTGTPNSREGLTSQGDSGGPLILQNFSRQLVIGVLSGGYTRFFTGAPANGYGTVSFYQPLYLYWDWIAANNPYHYVASVAGNASWTDPTHWVSTLDPAYYILSGGQPVNGIPTDLGEQKNGTSGDFGQICFQQGGVSECYDTRTGVTVIEARPIGTGDDVAAAANQPALTLVTDDRGIFDAAVRESQAGGATAALPGATLTNGLPGATNFVPNNVDPVRTSATAVTQPRYFDVTLAATGITTLGGNNTITIDRLTVGTAGAQLVIDAGSSLRTLINTTQFAGFVTVNGRLTSVGDYSLMGGGLLGTGTIEAPFLTSILGQIAPGTTSTVGTLTLNNGNLILASGSTYFVNLGPNGTSDRIAVVGGVTGTGVANIGGSVQISSVAGSFVRAGDLYTILTATGGITGTFAQSSASSAILRPQFIYSNNAVQLRVVAGSYGSVIAQTPVQRSFAALLDQQRGGAGLAGLYDVLDLQSQATIQATLEGWAPRAQTLLSAIGTTAVDNNSRLIRSRLSGLEPGNLGGGLATYGRPIQTAALAINRSNGVGDNGMTMTDTAVQEGVAEGRLPETMSAFLAGGYLEGNSAPMPTALPFGGDDQFDGWYIAGGIETEVGDDGIIGFALSYTNIEGTTSAGGQTAEGQLYQGTIYTKQTFGSFYLDSQLSAGLYSSQTTRPGNLPGVPITLSSDTNSLALAAEAGIGAWWGGTIQFGPRAALRSTYIGFDRSLETGGVTALAFDREEFTSVQGRLGGELRGRGRFRPQVSATYVHDFNERPTVFGGTFAGGSPLLLPAGFALSSTDQDWFEVSGGITFSAGNVDISLSADTTLDRDDVENQSYRASIAFRF